MAQRRQPARPGSRHDLRLGLSPDAPDDERVATTTRAHAATSTPMRPSSRLDGPGIRVALFLSGCLLRCHYCHNPDTWHLKDGTYVSAEPCIERLGDFAPALRSMDGGLTISGGEALVQLRLQPPDTAAREVDGPAHGDRDIRLPRRSRRRDYLSKRRPGAARHQDRGSRHLSQGDRAANSPRHCASPSGWRQWASRSGCASRWCRASPTIRRMSRSVARFVAPMKNVEWVEVLPFHQIRVRSNGRRSALNTSTPTPRRHRRLS